MEKLPVLFLIFKRSDNVLRSLEPIRKYKPSRIYIGADGPRKSKFGEEEECRKTRRIVLNAIDWKCEVFTLFRDENLGCAMAVSEAITWFFKNEDYGIIIEEDCVLHIDFFNFCEILLPLYKENSNIMQICAHNPGGSKLISNEYYFGYNTHIWGWATWKRAWNKMDMDMSHLSKVRIIDLIKKMGFFQGLFQKYYWKRSFKKLKSQVLNSWATRWSLTVYAQEGLCLSPKANMCKNIGVDNYGGTHYYKGYIDPYENLEYGKIIFPLKHPQKKIVSKLKVRQEKQNFKKLKYFGLINKLKKK